MSIFSCNFSKPFKRLRFENTFSANPNFARLDENNSVFLFLTRILYPRKSRTIYQLTWRAIAHNSSITLTNVLQYMKNYTKTKVIRISEIQLQTLQKLKSYNVDVGNFIRSAIKEKIKREYSDLLPKPKKTFIPF